MGNSNGGTPIDTKGSQVGNMALQKGLSAGLPA